MFLLALAVGAIVLQSNFSLTGNAVLGEYADQLSCEGAGYTWESITNETCTDISNCTLCATGCVSTYTETLCLEGCQQDCTNVTNCTLCSTGCVSSYTETLCSEGCQTSCQTCEDVVIGGQCTGDVCDASHLSLCLTQETCTTATGYWYNDLCNLECTENWECVEWGECSGGTKTRTCTDTNSCGTEANIPSLSHDCTETTTTEDTTEESTTDDSSSESVTSSAEILTCSPNWVCDESWSECIEGNQIRACTDVNNCGINDGIPATSQACVVEIKETCEDGIQNQDEIKVDCGGVCKKCSIFVMAGSVISGPVGKVGEFFSNKTNIFISAGVLGFLVVGFLTFKFFRKHRIKITSK